jgi:uncharacterized protein YycO
MKSKSIIKICVATVLLMFAIALVFTKLIPYLNFQKYKAENGDLIFQSLPLQDLVLAIEGLSESPYSHCGIVVDREGEWFVLEAIGPVKYTPLYEWVQRGREESFAVYRLKDNTGVKPFITAAENYLGKPYDVRYRMDEEKIYCSELIYKAYFQAVGIKLGELKALGEMPWQEYTKTIRKYEQGEPPLERLMITPANLAKAKELELCYKQSY